MSLKDNYFFAFITTDTCYELGGICVPQEYGFLYPNSSSEVLTVAFSTVTRHQGTLVKGYLSAFKQSLPTNQKARKNKTTMTNQYKWQNWTAQKLPVLPWEVDKFQSGPQGLESTWIGSELTRVYSRLFQNMLIAWRVNVDSVPVCFVLAMYDVFVSLRRFFLWRITKYQHGMWPNSHGPNSTIGRVRNHGENSQLIGDRTLRAEIPLWSS